MASDFQQCSDEDLARQCQDGSLAAFEELVYRYEGRIYGFVANACRNPTEAREVTQDTFVRAFQAIGRFDCRREFGPWLFTIARRKCVDHYRAAPPAADEVLPDAIADGADPAELLAQQEERDNLWGVARRRLPAPQFQALWLRYAEGMSVAGMAPVLRKTQTHVKVLLFRARQTLLRALQTGHGSGLPAEGVTSRVETDRESGRSAFNQVGSGKTLSSVVALPEAVVSSEHPCARKGPV